MENGLQGVTQQTLDAIKKIITGQPADVVRKDISTATGLVAYNLEPAARLLQPIFTPLRNRIPRVGNTKGGTAVNWKVIQSLDIDKTDVFGPEGGKAATISYSVADKSQAFKVVEAGDNVTFKAQSAGRTFEDVKARAVARLLKTVLAREEQAIMGGRSSALPAVTAPTVTVVDGGGTVADATYNVFVRAITYMRGSGTTARGRFSAATSTGAIANGDDSAIRATVPWVEGASRYEWYVGTAGNEKLEATTTINSVELKALAGTGATKAAVAAADTGNGAIPNAFDGLFAQLDSSANLATTLATGTPGVGTNLSLGVMDDLLQNMWDTYFVDPDLLLVNSEESINLTNLVLAANGAPTLYVTNGGDKSSITGGYRVTSYINKATGKPIPVEVHPYLPQGTMAFLTFEMPFSASDIDAPIEIETLQEYQQIDYPMTAKKWEFEVYVDEAVKLYFPGSCGIIRNIAPQ